MRQLIEDLISAMEYHVEQTRPIHSTTVALQAAREALRAQPAPVQEPVAWVTGFYAGRCVIKTINPAAILPVGVALYTTPPAAKNQFVGLTDEERMDILLNLNWDKKLSHMGTALAIEAKLKEKNTP